MKKNAKFLVVIVLVCIFYLFGSNKCFANGDGEVGSTSNNQEMNIYSINVGQGINGESTLVESNGEYLLMDIGDRASYENINSFLQEKNITHFSLYLSHFHGDHTGGFTNDENNLAPMYKLMRDYDIDCIYLPDISLLKYKGEKVAEYQDVYYRKVKEFYENSIQTKEHPEEYKTYDEILVTLKKGDTFSFGSVNANVIGPVGIDDYTSPLKEGESVICPENTDEDLLEDYQNNCSLVTKMVCGNISFLTAGDLKTDGENALINEYAGTDVLKSTIYKASHHGSFPANGENFLACIQPNFSFVSNYAGTGLGEGKFWKIHTTQVNCNKYGFFYMGGNENKTLEIDVENNNISLYRYGDSKKMNAPGWCTVVGGDGTDRTNEYFYFGDNGYTLNGVQCIDGKYYYLGTGGYRHYGTGSGNEYHGMRTCEEDGKKRYFTQEDGSMYVNEAKEINDGVYGGFYCFDGEGVLVVPASGSWEMITVGGYTYGVNTSGKLSTNTFYHLDDTTHYYFENDGRMATGWKTIKEHTYYFSPDNGKAYTGFQKIGDYYYKFSDYGRIQTGFKETPKGTCYFDPDDSGKMSTGWKEINGSVYYLNSKSGVRSVGLKKIGNNYYFFSDYGKRQDSKFVRFDDGTRYFNYKGKMYFGMKNIGKNTYYFDEENGYRATGFTKIDNDYYFFDGTGKMQKNTFKYFDEGARYFNDDGKMAKGWKEIDGEKYYFDSKTGTRTIGLRKIGDYYYYFGSTGKMFKSRSKYINDVKYDFNSKGRITNVPVPEATYITSLSSSSTEIYVRWAKRSADGYQIYISTSKDGEYTKAATVKNGDTKYRSIKQLSKNKGYYVKIRSYKNIGDLKVYSDFSAVKYIKTLK